jgi:hypothetical protein
MSISNEIIEIKPFLEEEYSYLIAMRMGMKLGSRLRLLNSLQKQHEENPTDENAMLAYGLALYMLRGIEKDMEYAKAQIRCYIVMTGCLKLHETWWLPRYIRSEISKYIPGGLAEMSSSIRSIDSIVPSSRDQEKLIHFQEKSIFAFPYFMCPYMGQIMHKLQESRIEEAKTLFKRACEYVDCKPTYHTQILSQVFLDVIIICNKLGENQFAHQVRDKAIQIFPKSRTLAESLKLIR